MARAAKSTTASAKKPRAAPKAKPLAAVTPVAEELPPEQPEAAQEPDMPHVNEAQAAALENRNADGKYELEPEHRHKPGAEPGTLVRADGPYDGPITPTPAGLIRMTHPEGAVSDGFQTDESGAILVPHSQVEAMKSHGFVVDHLPAE